MTSADVILKRLAVRALDYVADGSVIGLGTGRAASMFMTELAERIRTGLRVKGVATSVASERLAGEVGIALVALDDVTGVDVDVDGADEIDPHGNLIKGYGGALVREKVVASAARQLVILAGAEKLVPTLGSRGRLPIEVIPFALATCRRRLAELGLVAEPRQVGQTLFTTDNGNHLLDCRVSPLVRPDELEQLLVAIPGVVGTGLFLGMRPTVLIGYADRVEVQNYNP
jgi:ribose 5-phosphate isomerase A